MVLYNQSYPDPKYLIFLNILLTIIFLFPTLDKQNGGIHKTWPDPNPQDPWPNVIKSKY